MAVAIMSVFSCGCATNIHEYFSSRWQSRLEFTPQLCLRLCIGILRPFAGQVQTLVHRLRLSGYQLHLEVSRYRHQCGLEVVVINVVGVRWLFLAGNNLETADQADEGSV